MNNAGLPKQEKSLIMASSLKRLRFEDASANMRRVFGSCGGGGGQDVLLTEWTVKAEESDGDVEA